MMYSFDDFDVKAKVIECINQTVTVVGLPFWFDIRAVYTPIIAGTDAVIIDCISTYEIALLYLDKPVDIKTGSVIHIIPKD